MIDMSGWASVGRICDGRDHALTRAEVRALLAEGAECRRDIERRQRAPIAHRFIGTHQIARCDLCGVIASGPGALRPCHGYWAGP